MWNIKANVINTIKSALFPPIISTEAQRSQSFNDSNNNAITV